MRRASHEGQTALALQENAIKKSWPQFGHRLQLEPVAVSPAVSGCEITGRNGDNREDILRRPLSNLGTGGNDNPQPGIAFSELPARFAHDHNCQVGEILRFKQGGADKGRCLGGAVCADRVGAVRTACYALVQVGYEPILRFLPVGEECRGRDRRLALSCPALPIAAEALNPEPGKPDLFREGQCDRWTRLQSSRQVVRVIGSNFLPVTLSALLGRPLPLSCPVPRCYSNQRRLLSSLLVGFLHSFFVVSVRLGGYIALNADLSHADRPAGIQGSPSLLRI
jgi:hypothetical protein